MYRALPEVPDVPSVPIQIKRPGNKRILMQLCVLRRSNRECSHECPEGIADFLFPFDRIHTPRGINNRGISFSISIDRTLMNHYVIVYRRVMRALRNLDDSDAERRILIDARRGKGLYGRGNR